MEIAGGTPRPHHALSKRERSPFRLNFGKYSHFAPDRSIGRGAERLSGKIPISDSPLRRRLQAGSCDMTSAVQAKIKYHRMEIILELLRDCRTLVLTRDNHGFILRLAQKIQSPLPQSLSGEVTWFGIESQMFGV
jgi:hypothetical protein